MKYLFLLFCLHFYFCSFSQIDINKTETETVPPPPPSRIPKQNYGDTIDIIFEDERYELPPTPPPPPPPPIKSEKPIKPPVAPIIEFPEMEAAFPCYTFYNYDTLGNVISNYERCGVMGMMTFINQNVVYPQTSIEMNDQGRVFLTFIVEKDGSITNVRIERGVSTEIDREAKRVISEMPNWIPGKSGGYPVRCRVRVPINFKLN